MKFLSQSEAQQLDELLMSPHYGFTLTQLMELAGLSVAQAIHDFYPVEQYEKILVLCGPGNNGGDGLVAARHLASFGYQVSVHVSRVKPILEPLIVQAESFGVRLTPETQGDFCMIVDAVLGFGSYGTVRAPYDVLVRFMSRATVPVVSVDAPTGWSVDGGTVKSAARIEPEMLISLFAPKLCAAHFKGKHHILGGRFPASLPSTIFAILDLYHMFIGRFWSIFTWIAQCSKGLVSTASCLGLKCAMQESRIIRYVWNKRTTAAFIFAFTCFAISSYTNFVASNLASYRSPSNKTYPILPDLGFDLIPEYKNLGLTDGLDNIIIFSSIAFIVFEDSTPLFSFFKMFLCFAITYTLRSTCVFLTSLPDPRMSCVRIEGNFFTSFPFHRCGDCIFSGHAAVCTLFSLYWLYVKPTTRNVAFHLLRTLIWLTALAEMWAIIANRSHYSVDVVIAIYVSTGVFFTWTHFWETQVEAKGSLKDLTHPHDWVLYGKNAEMAVN